MITFFKFNLDYLIIIFGIKCFVNRQKFQLYEDLIC